MKKMILPIIIVVLALAAADIFFGLDIEELFQGFGNFIGKILSGKAG